MLKITNIKQALHMSKTTTTPTTPEPARIDELIKFHQHSQRETKIELESYERDSLEYQRTQGFIEDSKLYLKT